MLFLFFYFLVLAQKGRVLGSYAVLKAPLTRNPAPFPFPFPITPTSLAIFYLFAKGNLKATKSRAASH